jgi:hypothetical protein
LRDNAQPPTVITEEGDIEYGIERILQARTRRVSRGTRRELLMKWASYTEPTWEPYSNLKDIVALDIFEQENRT